MGDLRRRLQSSGARKMTDFKNYPFSSFVHLKRPTSPEVQTLRKNTDSIIAGRAVLNLVVEHREARAHGLWEMDQIAARRTAH